MFGVEDAALRSPRNGLFLNKVVEKGFDNGWIAIVPDGSIEATPTEWKIVVLNEDIRANTVYTLLEPERGVIRWNVSLHVISPTIARSLTCIRTWMGVGSSF